MQNKIKHITLFLVVVFLTPLIVQNAHVFEHHTHTHHCADDHNTQEADLYFTHTGHFEDCLICEYEFSTFDNLLLPGYSTIISVIYQKVYTDFYDGYISPSTVNNYTRGPPELA